MTTERILTIQDISCVGQCSLTVALPLLSACGLETAILPSAVLSTHTGGFTGFTFRDLTDDIPLIVQHWQKENIDFSAIYTGYLGSSRQIEMVKNTFSTVLKKGGKKIVDPAMADNGKLYTGFDEQFVDSMCSLVAEADIILPNITEAAFLCKMEYREDYDNDYIEELVAALYDLCKCTIILTGVSYMDSKTGVLLYDGNETQYYGHRKIGGGFHGTGDIYSSAFTGALLRGKTEFEAAMIAADYTLSCIENTIDDKNHPYGVHFEPSLKQLIEAVER